MRSRTLEELVALGLLEPKLVDAPPQPSRSCAAPARLTAAVMDRRRAACRLRRAVNRPGLWAVLVQ